MQPRLPSGRKLYAYIRMISWLIEVASSKMPNNLHKHLPGVPQATITKLYGSIKSARHASPEVRQGVIEGDCVLVICR